MAFRSSPPGSPGRPSGPPSNSSSPCSTSATSSSAPSNPFLFRRRRRPKKPRSPPSSPSSSSKNPQAKPISNPEPKRFIGPLPFDDFFQETFSPALGRLFIILGDLNFVGQNTTDLSTASQTYDVINSFTFMVCKCSQELTEDTSDHHQPTLTPGLLIPISTPPQGAAPKQEEDDDDVWEWRFGPCKELEDVLKEGMIKLIAASIKVSKIPATSTDRILSHTFPRMATDLKTVAQRFQSMFKIVRRQLELELMHGTSTAGDA